MNTYRICDPFAGDLDIEGEDLNDAIERAYADVPADETPEYVWYKDEAGRRRVDVPGGTCRPYS